MAVVNASNKPLRAEWPNGQRVQPGQDARRFLDETARTFGHNPKYIRDAIRRDTPAGRMILDLLGLTRESVMAVGRPEDTPRALLIRSVVDVLLATEISESEAFWRAPAYLSDPAKRARDRIGRGEGQVRGRGRHEPDMTPRAVRDAYRKAEGLTVALWFRYPGEPDGPDTSD